MASMTGAPRLGAGSTSAAGGGSRCCKWPSLIRLALTLLFALIVLATLQLVLLPPPDASEDTLTNPRALTSITRWLARWRPKRFGPAPKYLVLTSTSCKDIEPKPWITQADGTLYDVVVLDYSPDNHCRGRITPAPHRKLLHRPKAFKFPGAYGYFTSREGLEALASYKAFLISDDDIDFHGATQPPTLHNLFRACEAAKAYICQPSLSERSAVNFDVTSHFDHADAPHGALDDGTGSDGVVIYRSTGFVEQMAPIFTREALGHFLPYFSGVTHAWGIDALWSDFSSRLDKKLVVVDSIQIDHMRPSGISGLYKRVGGVDKAKEEQEAFKAKHGIREAVFGLTLKGHRGHGEQGIAQWGL